MVGHTPPPFFKRGPAPLVRLCIYGLIALSLLVSDLRLRYLDVFRQGLSVLAYPLQMAAATPAEFVRNASEYFASLVRLQRENADLRRRQLTVADRLLKQDALERENLRLRALLEMRDRQPVKSMVAELLYSAKDPFSRRVILDKGARSGILAGQAVVDEVGVVGQVTRVYPMLAEVALLTDKDQAIPIMNLRSGLRGVLFGAGNGHMELRYMATNADVQPGDKLVTSGLDGVFMPGLPVAVVARVDRDVTQTFARIPCLPAAGVERNGQVLVLGPREALPPRPESPDDTPAVKKKPRRGRE